MCCARHRATLPQVLHDPAVGSEMPPLTQPAAKAAATDRPQYRHGPEVLGAPPVAMKNPPFAQYAFTLKLAMIGNFQLAMFDCARVYPENLV